MLPLLLGSTDKPNPPTHLDSQIPCDLVDWESLVDARGSCCVPSLLYFFHDVNIA